MPSVISLQDTEARSPVCHTSPSHFPSAFPFFSFFFVWLISPDPLFSLLFSPPTIYQPPSTVDPAELSTYLIHAADNGIAEYLRLTAGINWKDKSIVTIWMRRCRASFISALESLLRDVAMLTSLTQHNLEWGTGALTLTRNNEPDVSSSVFGLLAPSFCKY